MSISDIVPGRVSLRPVESIESAPRVRHVDELSEPALEQFYELVSSSGGSAAADPSEFLDGEVIVFTEYYRVESH